MIPFAKPPNEWSARAQEETVERLYRQAPLGMAATVVNSIVLSAVLWNVVPRKYIFIWFACLIALTLYQYFVVYQYRNRSSATALPAIHDWNSRFITGMAMTGVAWGAGGILLFPESSPAHQAFLAFVLGGMVAGAAGAFSVSLPSFLAFSIPALAPLSLCFFKMGGAVHVAMGGLVILYGILISGVAFQVHASAAASSRLRFENDNLVAYLATAKERADRLNTSLMSEIAERHKAEQELQEHRDGLEDLVHERTAELLQANEHLQKEIAARKDAETSLSKSEEYFRSLIENTMDIITVIDNRGMILFESPSVTRLLGYEPVDLVGRSVFDYLHHDDLPQAREIFTRLITAPGTSGSIEVRFRHKNGAWRTIDANGKSILDTGGDIRIMINSRDNTERKKLEGDLLKAQKLESLGTLAGGIAHDFNNLITGITTNIELAILNASGNVKLRSLLNKAEVASVRAKDLTQQLLTFSRGGAPVKKTLAIGDVIRDAVSFALRGSNTACEFSLPGDLRPVEGDEGQLRQALHNIIINADEAMPLGGVISVNAGNITVSERELQSLTPGDYVFVAVADHGVGIPKEHLSNIFDPFFTTKQKGSGLGLATTYSIMKKHGGHITVASEVGAGTTVTIYLPASSSAVEPKAESVGLVNGSGRILLMDDEDIIRDAARNILEAAGYEVETAKDGKEAIVCYEKARAEGDPFDVVILDLTVPGGTGGRETVKRLLDLDPGVKAIVSSGYSNDPIMANYADFGFRGVIAKPYRVREMSEIVKKVASGSA